MIGLLQVPLLKVAWICRLCDISACWRLNTLHRGCGRCASNAQFRSTVEKNQSFGRSDRPRDSQWAREFVRSGVFGAVALRMWVHPWWVLQVTSLEVYNLQMTLGSRGRITDPFYVIIGIHLHRVYRRVFTVHRWHRWEYNIQHRTWVRTSCDLVYFCSLTRASVIHVEKNYL